MWQRHFVICAPDLLKIKVNYIFEMREALSQTNKKLSQNQNLQFPKNIQNSGFCLWYRHKLLSELHPYWLLSFWVPAQVCGMLLGETSKLSLQKWKFIKVTRICCLCSPSCLFSCTGSWSSSGMQAKILPNTTLQQQNGNRSTLLHVKLRRVTITGANLKAFYSFRKSKL